MNDLSLFGRQLFRRVEIFSLEVRQRPQLSDNELIGADSVDVILANGDNLRVIIKN